MEVFSVTGMDWKNCVFLALICGSFTIGAYADSTVIGDLRGEWGGKHIRLIVKETVAAVEFDCAFGQIDGPVHPDKDGNFEVYGVYMFERGGPHRAGEPPPQRHPALYRGWTDGKEMRLTVTLIETGKDMGTFLLGLGRAPSLDKCL
jgi:hypothetical protein